MGWQGHHPRSCEKKPSSSLLSLEGIPLYSASSKNSQRVSGVSLPFEQETSLLGEEGTFLLLLLPES